MCIFIKSNKQNDLDSITENHLYVAKNFEEYLIEVTENHQPSFKKIYYNEFKVFCNDNQLNLNDLNNQKQYFQLKILNDLFTSSSAQNNSVGEILSIPYMWHWCSPNPRHSIVMNENQKNLIDIKPNKEFKKYKSFADIDRTSFLYLSDLMSPEIKYSNLKHKEILTFGWCSEREMSFNTMLKILKYKAKIFTKDNHCWTETLVDFVGNNGQKVKFNGHIDNTFHQFYFTKFNIENQKTWLTDFGNVPLGKCYNQMAKSEIETDKVRTIKVHQNKMNYIENKINIFIKSKI